jgi:hypothetical protein
MPAPVLLVMSDWDFKHVCPEVQRGGSASADRIMRAVGHDPREWVLDYARYSVINDNWHIRLEPRGSMAKVAAATMEKFAAALAEARRQEQVAANPRAPLGLHEILESALAEAEPGSEALVAEWLGVST